jgi:spore maturation protein CgeB
MKFVIFCHSVLSDWNHGNAHFLRGVIVELQSRGHRVEVFEPRGSWSVANLVRDHGAAALTRTLEAYPALCVTRYDESLDVEAAIDDADVVLVHEWNTPELVAAVGRTRASRRRQVVLFHDTHHRSVSAKQGMRQYALADYDGVLAFGEAVRQQYLQDGWAARVWTWHEAADVRRFTPRPVVEADADLVWIGNWGDDERTAELHEFLIQPARQLALRGSVYGVRYPAEGLAALSDAGLRYGGWMANYDVPEVFARHHVTVHVPRRPYAAALPGIPTIRPFEALACGIPLVSAPWHDTEGLFREGTDYLVASTGAAMRRQIHAVLHDPDLARSLSKHGRETVLARHTCAHRVDELLGIVRAIRLGDRDERRGDAMPRPETGTMEAYG